MDKLKLAGQNPGRVFNFRLGRSFAPYTSFVTEKLPNSKWKTRLGSAPLAFALPDSRLKSRLVLITNFFFLKKEKIFLPKKTEK
jgi:hypothetical protein